MSLLYLSNVESFWKVDSFTIDNYQSGPWTVMSEANLHVHYEMTFHWYLTSFAVHPEDVSNGQCLSNLINLSNLISSERAPSTGGHKQRRTYDERKLGLRLLHQWAAIIGRVLVGSLSPEGDIECHEQSRDKTGRTEWQPAEQEDFYHMRTRLLLQLPVQIAHMWYSIRFH